MPMGGLEVGGLPTGSLGALATIGSTDVGPAESTEDVGPELSLIHI